MITNNAIKCLLMKCTSRDTLLLWCSCQNVQPESHEKPLDKPKLRDLQGASGTSQHERSKEIPKSMEWVIWIDFCIRKSTVKGHIKILSDLVLLCPHWHSLYSDPQLISVPLTGPVSLGLPHSPPLSTLMHTTFALYFAERSSVAPQGFKSYPKICSAALKPAVISRPPTVAFPTATCQKSEVRGQGVEGGGELKFHPS